MSHAAENGDLESLLAVTVRGRVQSKQLAHGVEFLISAAQDAHLTELSSINAAQASVHFRVAFVSSTDGQSRPLPSFMLLEWWRQLENWAMNLSAGSNSVNDFTLGAAGGPCWRQALSEAAESNTTCSALSGGWTGALPGQLVAQRLKILSWERSIDWKACHLRLHRLPLRTVKRIPTDASFWQELPATRPNPRIPPSNVCVHVYMYIIYMLTYVNKKQTKIVCMYIYIYRLRPDGGPS